MNISKGMKNILTGLYLSLKRFPLTIFLSVSVTAVLITISELRPVEDTLSKIAMVLSLGIPLSLCITLFFEKYTSKNIYKLLSYFVAGLFLSLYYFLLLKDMGMVSTTRYVAVSLALYLAFFFIPYLEGKKQFELYVITVFTCFFLTVIYSIVLFAGLSAILFTIDSLLEIAIPGELYYYTWLFVVFVFAISYFLSGIPMREEDMTSKAYPKLLKILLLYIVIPLLTAYTVILYIYFGKIIITRQWPVGLVSHLVLWYSVIVTSVIFFITPLFEKNNVSTGFLKLAPKVILPLLIMMFISIGIRINAYGITERRYYVVILALWVFSMMLLFSFAKSNKNLLIPITLALLAMISVFGPLSSYSVSKYSQNKRFENILQKNNMLKDGNIILASNVSKEDKLDLSSILNYFEQNHSLNDLKYLPKDFAIANMENLFGFTYELQNNQYTDDYFYFTRRDSGKYIDIKGYDYMVDIRTLTHGNPNLNKDLNVAFNYETSIVNIKYKDKPAYSKDLSVFVKDLIIKYGYKGSETTIPEDEMTLIDENDTLKVKFVFINISGNRNDYSNTHNGKGYEFYLLIKIK
jgi:hypothetical protein